MNYILLFQFIDFCLDWAWLIVPIWAFCFIAVMLII
nr:MAG TPA: hypothetical protein [Caudoviricetes sp.]